MKVVDLINNSPAEARPTVLVSATAVGYYGLFNPICGASKVCICESDHANKSSNTTL